MLLLLLIFSFPPSRDPYTFTLGRPSSSGYFMIFSVVCQGRGWAQRLNKDQGASPWWGIIEPRRLPVPLSQISIQILLWRPPPHLELCRGLGLLSVSQWSQAQGSTSWEISDLQWFGNEIRGSPARLAAWGTGHLQSWASRLAWCLCRPTQSHNYLPHLVSQVVWSCVK